MGHEAIRGTDVVLSVHDVTIQLPAGADRAHAIQRVSFDVRRGETVCIVGESGSGKSVLASAIMGLLPSELKCVQGSMRLLGRELIGAPQKDFRSLRGTSVAMVFQEPMTALNPVMTCGDQVDEILRCHTDMTPSARRDAVLGIFQRVRLPEPERIYTSYPHQLSGGQRQRIVIAVALILKPALVICDEPTTALDVTTQAEILALLGELQRENGTAVLFITHDLGVVADIGDEVVVLQLGSMVERGESREVLGRPRHPYTQMLVDAIPHLAEHARAQIADKTPLLEVRGVKKTYYTRGWFGASREVSALEPVSLSIRPGETVGVVGESGSGKSTLARCIARMTETSAGAIRLDGVDVTHSQGRGLSDFRRQVQMIYQDPYRSLNPRRTVGASIIEGAVNFGLSEDQAWQRAEELMELVRLKPEALRRYPSEFSGGQRQRISIARALACEPKLLIADEAVSALDVSVQAQVLDLLVGIQEATKVAILFITHDLRVASQICDRVMVMHRGKIIEEGEANTVLSSPKDSYTRKLIQAAPGKSFSFGRSILTETLPA
jgi:peptide/nickel transport system ATP-binding protein